MSRARILIVDDEPDLAGFIGEILQAHDYEVDVCSNGQQALTRLKERGYHCVVTDLKMPEMSGRELCTWIRANRGDLPIVTMSGYDASESEVTGFNIARHIYKPFSSKVLLDALAFSVEIKRVV